MNMTNCTICNNNLSTSPLYIAREMMFGTREKFEYYQCLNCNALQIKSIPDNISKYYKNYYTNKKQYKIISPVKKFLWQIRRYFALSGFYPIIRIISPNSILEWASKAKININSKILDVGCGNGDVLFEFSKHGFKNLYGIDPFLVENNLQGINFEKNDLIKYQPNLKFDLIMFNHSLEHISDHQSILKKSLKILEKDGTIMVRVPVINKAFEIYKENWVQIDAPRHLIIHSIKSMTILCENNGAEIYEYYFDSTAFQFLGSEQFKKDIPSNAPISYKTDLNKSIFTKEDLNKYDALAKKYNKQRLGDSAVFFIRGKNENKL